jgi:predicted anti-sigma-YlaC factor YlaD
MNEFMNADLHERARMLIALSGPEDVPSAEQSWLTGHLESCAACREFAENLRETIRGLRALPITAGASLVSRTQMRVRQRAQELQRRQERMWVVSICCTAVTLGTAFSTALLWGGLAWVGQQVRLSPAVWEIPFAVFCLMPGLLVGTLLLARGTYLADRNGHYQDGPYQE